MCKVFMTMLLAFCGSIAISQDFIYHEIQNLKLSGAVSERTDLFQLVSTDVRDSEFNLEGLSKGVIINLDKSSIQDLFQKNPDFIQLDVPVSDRSEITLTLKRHEIFTPDFKLFTSENPNTPIEYTPGVHYRGIVEGDPSSIVAISIFNDHVIGLIATNEGNFNLGKIENDEEGRYILYNDKDLEKLFSFTCKTEEDDRSYTEEELQSLSNDRDQFDCVRVYIEINDDIVSVKGGAGPATDYITAILNQSFVMYANESVSLVISEIKVWTTPSPYTSTDSGVNLSIFKQTTHWLNGDLAHLITFDSLLGVASSTIGPCSVNPDQRKCASGITNNFADVPVFSWPVFVITHEMGHLLGSNHTHVCVWNGNGTSIDACGYNGDSPCPGPDPQIPVDGGTIMSYCTPGRGYFINFNEGFGPQPGNLIRNNVNAANNCLYPCDDLPMYCLSFSNNSSHKYIESVILNSINHTSNNNNGYGNFHSLSTTLTAGNTYSITFKPGSNAGTKYWRAWIDYNDDEDWDDPEELIVQISGTQQVTTSFTVPASLSPVTARLRVSMAYSGFVPPCGAFESGEVEDYTVVVTNNTGATCSDGIQNQDETGIDCGGPCTACPPEPTCNDGIQNQGETGVDCGGPCPACPPAPTCTDGIQNQNETGIDCGGVCPACEAGDSTLVLGSYFETGLDAWTDGGPDVARVNSPNSFEGTYSIKLADNSGAQSAMTSPACNLSDAVGARIAFHFYASSMENGEDFFVQYKSGSGAWNTIATLVSGTHFSNNSFYAVSLLVPNFTPTADGSFRIQCDASDNNDQVFIDAVTIYKLNGTELIEAGIVIHEISKTDFIAADDDLKIYPNPAQAVINLQCKGEIQEVRVIGMDGRDYRFTEINFTNTAIDVSQLPGGVYFLMVRSGHKMLPGKFIKI